MVILLVLRACRRGDSKVLCSEYVSTSSKHSWAGRAMAESQSAFRDWPQMLFLSPSVLQGRSGTVSTQKHTRPG